MKQTLQKFGKLMCCMTKKSNMSQTLSQLLISGEKMEKLGLNSSSVKSKEHGKAFPEMVHTKMSSEMAHCPSPLDSVRFGQKERRTQFGLSPAMCDSFEANQSFPKCSRLKLNIPSRKINIDSFKSEFFI